MRFWDSLRLRNREEESFMEQGGPNVLPSQVKRLLISLSKSSIYIEATRQTILYPPNDSFPLKSSGIKEIFWKLHGCSISLIDRFKTIRIFDLNYQL